MARVLFTMTPRRSLEASGESWRGYCPDDDKGFPLGEVARERGDRALAPKCSLLSRDFGSELLRLSVLDVQGNSRPLRGHRVREQALLVTYAPLALEYGCTVVSAESRLVRDALARYRTQALPAKHLGITQSTVTRKAKQYSLESRAS